jgi:uncharacterized Zn finger protein
MIFPDVSAEEWILRYPDLFVISVKCKNCGNNLESTRPFVSKDYIGLTTHSCACGNSQSNVKVVIPKTEQSKKEWKRLF